MRLATANRELKLKYDQKYNLSDFFVSFLYLISHLRSCICCSYFSFPPTSSCNILVQPRVGRLSALRVLEVRERQPGAGRSRLGRVTSLEVEVSCLCTPPAAGKGRPAPGGAPTMTGALQGRDVSVLTIAYELQNSCGQLSSPFQERRASQLPSTHTRSSFLVLHVSISSVTLPECSLLFSSAAKQVWAQSWAQCVVF